MTFTTEQEGDQVVCTRADGQQVSIHIAIWEHSYAGLPPAALEARLEMLVKINAGL